MILESRYGADSVRDLDLFIAKAQVSLVPVDEEQADLARRAFRNMGRAAIRPVSTSHRPMLIVIPPAPQARRKVFQG
jgi:uncharacterized protein with PIN domain